MLTDRVETRDTTDYANALTEAIARQERERDHQEQERETERSRQEEQRKERTNVISMTGTGNSDAQPAQHMSQADRQSHPK